ncbi:DUF1573 domain-containing protein [Niabella aurantiaca]|uniref:DUF1573 domain-containing protein n=1 Tax=Niabella aurantiaca TaxID=379900 RepID=UPI000365A3AE|nr:DUF1573 domain-containing protein [Niabella aurantiaca]
MNQIIRQYSGLVFFAIFFYACNGHSDRSETKPTAKGKLPDRNNMIPDILKDSANFTTLRWEDSTYRDLKVLKRGDSAAMVYRFINTGNKPLIISDVKAGCGCTTPEWPKEPVLPGKKGVIRAVFYTKMQAAATHVKQIFVNANTSPHTGHILTFKAEVIE